jgi:microsomal dipeptidase-like Zn-dependent dipeptidase
VSSLDAAEELARMKHVQEIHAGGPSFEWPVQRVRVPELNAANRFDALAQALSALGYNDAAVRGISGANFARFFARVCG